MKILSRYRSVPAVVAGTTLFLSCFVLSGCTSWFVSTKTLLGENRDAFPAVVLSAQNHSHDYTFDWDQNTVGGLSLSKVKPDAKYWRMQVYRFSDGERIGNNTNQWKPLDSNNPEDKRETFTKLDFDKLMIVSLDVADSQDGLKNVGTYSINVLLHDE